MSASGRTLLAAAKQAYVGSMRAVGRGLDTSGLARGPVPPVERRLQHWVHSLTRIYDSVGMIELDVPWWTYDAVEEIDRWLAARERPARVFEYGSGASTVWLSKRVGEVHSVEHDRGFSELMAGRLAPLAHVSLQVVEPVESSRPLVRSGKAGHEHLDFTAYVDAVDAVEGDFDLIVVDGRARAACLAKAAARLAPGGVIVFDNSRRRRYREAIERSGLVERAFRGLTPTLPYPDQTSLLTAPVRQR